MKQYEITPLEIEVLEMLAGEREFKWGSWVGAALEFLSEAGLVTRGPRYQITVEGARVLASSK